MVVCPEVCPEAIFIPGRSTVPRRFVDDALLQRVLQFWLFVDLDSSQTLIFTYLLLTIGALNLVALAGECGGTLFYIVVHALLIDVLASQ